MPTLSTIILYPIKSLDGVAVDAAAVLPGGALQGDREFALVDREGQFVNGKRTETIHAIRTQFDVEARQVQLWTGAIAPQTFHLDQQRADLEAWFSDYFGYPVWLAQNTHQGFPDDTEASGPTLVSAATLATVAAWFPPMTLAEARQRFRTNLELEDAPAFWEDEQLTATGDPRPLQVGDVRLMSSNPCQRCIVPTRDPQTGDRTPQFQAQFIAQRRATLPANAPPTRFNHFYKLTLNTRVASDQAGKVLRVGDRVKSTE